MNGRKTDVLIEDNYYLDNRTGVYLKSNNNFTVWADKDMREIILSVDGVTNVFTPDCNTKYQVYIDKRYDIEFIKREVEAAVLCR